MGEGAYHEPYKGSSALHNAGLHAEHALDLPLDTPEPGGLLGELALEPSTEVQEQLDLLPQEPTVKVRQEDEEAGTG